MPELKALDCRIRCAAFLSVHACRNVECWSLGVAHNPTAFEGFVNSTGE